MPKTDIKKIKSEDVKELSDEALDRTPDAQHCGSCGGGHCATLSPAE
ncbi:MAG: hypothetical protein ISR48_06205 [Alphaproteobacteria bacterium]|nr:hypothetical protein [Alphaproteobacteria bacterium]